MAIELTRQQQQNSPTSSSTSGTALESLSAEDLKVIVEAIGFTANFDGQAIKLATIEIDGDYVEAIIEIAKNAKPADVALRYAKEVWLAEETEQLKSSLRTIYTTTASLARLRSFLGERWKIESANEENKIRIDLKQKTLSIIAQAVEDTQFSPSESQTAVDENTTISEVQSSAMPTPPVRSDRSSTVNDEPATQEKYSTYSRSEVDRMLRQQAENITSALGGKISGQTKLFQEAIAEQEKTFNKSIDKLMLNVDNFRTRLEANVTAQQGASKEQMEKFVADVTRELEQFKTSLNKSILPSIRALDERLSTVDTKTSKKEKQAPAVTTSNAPAPDPQAKLVLWLVTASAVTSAVSLVLQLGHH